MQASATENQTIMQGEYTLLDPIAGAPDVFRARSRADDRIVRVRLFHGAVSLSPERVLEKPQAAGRLQHPMLAPVYACGRESDGTFYVVSELPPGVPLRAWADEVGIPPLGSVVDFMHRVCQGLSAAHREGLAHDALHAGQIYISAAETAATQRLTGKLLDVGVPAFMTSWPPSLQVAQFLAPEQLEVALRLDATPLQADSRMNVYSCGCLLYYLCTGGVPFPTRTVEELVRAHTEGKIIPPSKINPQLSPSLEAVMLRALSVARGERYVTVAELGSALTHVRLPINTSGIRARVDVPSVRPRVDAGTARAQSSGFDERPTSESRMPADWTRRPISAPPPPSGDSLPPVLLAPTVEVMADSIARPSMREVSSTPAGSFSSAPPKASKSVPPEALNAAAARAFSSAPPGVVNSVPPPPPLGGLVAAASALEAKSASTPAPKARRITSAAPTTGEPERLADSSMRPRVSGITTPSGLPVPRSTQPSRPAAAVAPSPTLASETPLIARAAPPTESSAVRVFEAEHEPAQSALVLQAHDRDAAELKARPGIHPMLVGFGVLGLIAALSVWVLRPARDPAAVQTPITVAPPPQAAVPTVTRPRLQSSGERKQIAEQASATAPAPADAARAAAPVASAMNPAPAAHVDPEPIAEPRAERVAQESARVHRPAPPPRPPARRPSPSQRTPAPANEEPRADASTRAEPLESARPALIEPEFRPDAGHHATAAAPEGEPQTPTAREQPPARANKEADGQTARAPATSPDSPQVPLRAQAQIQAVSVHGSLATSVVARAAQRIRGQFEACYARAAQAAGSNGFGEVTVEVDLDERGRAQAPHATGGALPGLAACVADAASRLATDRAPDTGTVKAGWKVVFVP